MDRQIDRLADTKLDTLEFQHTILTNANSVNLSFPYRKKNQKEKSKKMEWKMFKTIKEKTTRDHSQAGR